MPRPKLGTAEVTLPPFHVDPWLTRPGRGGDLDGPVLMVWPHPLQGSIKERHSSTPPSVLPLPTTTGSSFRGICLTGAWQASWVHPRTPLCSPRLTASACLCVCAGWGPAQWLDSQVINIYHPTPPADPSPLLHPTSLLAVSCLCSQGGVNPTLSPAALWGKPGPPTHGRGLDRDLAGAGLGGWSASQEQCCSSRRPRATGQHWPHSFGSAM